jgi:nucleoside 2-deoxyribosyltransferase
MRIYLAAPLFSQIQRSWNRELADTIMEMLPGVVVILPQDFRTGGSYNNPKHYGALFRRCVHEVQSADMLLALLDGSEVDSGVSFEMGVAYAADKPIIGIRTDFRPGADYGVNLMCARACKHIVREYSFQEDLRVVAGAIVRRMRAVMKKGGNDVG